jgi:hypothetical protein
MGVRTVERPAKVRRRNHAVTVPQPVHRMTEVIGTNYVREQPLQDGASSKPVIGFKRYAAARIRLITDEVDGHINKVVLTVFEMIKFVSDNQAKAKQEMANDDRTTFSQIEDCERKVKAAQDSFFTDLVDNCRRWALTNLVIDRRPQGTSAARRCAPRELSRGATAGGVFDDQGRRGASRSAWTAWRLGHQTHRADQRA